MDILKRNEIEINRIMMKIFKIAIYFINPLYIVLNVAFFSEYQTMYGKITIILSSVFTVICIGVVNKGIIKPAHEKYFFSMALFITSYVQFSTLYMNYLIVLIYPILLAVAYFDKKLLTINSIISILIFVFSDIVASFNNVNVLSGLEWIPIHIFNYVFQLSVVISLVYLIVIRASDMLNEVLKLQKESEIEKENAVKNYQKLIIAEDIALCGSWEYEVGTKKLYLSENSFKRLGMNAEEDLSIMTAKEYVGLIREKYTIVWNNDRHVDPSEFDEEEPILDVLGIDKKYIGNANGMKESYIVEYQNNEKQTAMINYALPIIEDGKLVRLIGTAKDVTLERNKESQLIKSKMEADKQRNIAEEASASQSRFVANMSHEIRTPLNAILGYAEVLKSFNDDDKLDYYLDAINSSGNILLDIVTDILDFSKVNAGKYTANYIPCNIGDFLEEIKILFWQKINMKDLDFELIYDVDTPTLLLPVSVIRQIIINILGNAIKFTNEGSVTVKAICIEKNSKYNMSIEVIDTGIGIEDDKKEFIFKEFEQAEESHQKVGTGLGLAISRKFAEVIGGEILLESEVGKGSTFTLSIENIEISELNVESAYNKKEDIDFEFIYQKVMVVDDIKDNRDVLKAHCHNLKLDPKTYFSGRDALKNISIFKPDIILTDLRMPEMNGEDFAKFVKEQDKKIPILCITASIDPDTRYDLQYFDDVLNKPIASSVLAKVMAKYLETKKIDEEVQFDINTAFKTIQLSDEEISDVKDKFHEKLENLKVAIKPKKVKILAEELIKYGEKSQVKIFKDIGETLEDASKTVNIVLMMETISKFAEYLDSSDNHADY